MLDLSLAGRTRRLSFFLMEAGFGIVTIVPILVVVMKSAAQGLPLIEMQRQTGPVMALTVLVLAWPRLALAVRRARDAGLGPWIGYSYCGLLTLGSLHVAYDQYQGHPTLGPGMLSGLGVWVLWGLLQFKRSAEPTGIERDEIETFGARPVAAVPETGLSALSSEDLLARAEMLRAVDGASAEHAVPRNAPAAPAATTSRAGGAAARSFGRRGQPAFGRR